MKKSIFILSLFIAGIFTSYAQEECDTLKLKVTKSYYTQLNGSNIKVLDELNGAVINIDTLSSFYLGANMVNVSNDIFHSTNTYSFGAGCIAYADTGRIGEFWGSIAYSFGREFTPNDTMSAFIEIRFDLAYMINSIKEAKNIDLEQISYWKMIIGCGYTDKDGYYSDSVFAASGDTSIFYLVRTPVNIQERENELTDISIFPNPARSHFTVTNTENATVYLYNLLGQKVKQVTSTEENTVIQTEDLSAGMYVLKVEKGNAVVTKKVQVMK